MLPPLRFNGGSKPGPRPASLARTRSYRERGEKSGFAAQADARQKRRLTPGRFAADRGDRDVTHRRIGLGAMPMTFASFDLHDITDIDLALFSLVGDQAGARDHDQQLIAIMNMPARIAALAEIHHAAIVIRRFTGLDNRLARPGDWPGPSFGALGGTLGRDIWDIFKRDHLHDDTPLGLIALQGIRIRYGHIVSQLNATSASDSGTEGNRRRSHARVRRPRLKFPVEAA